MSDTATRRCGNGGRCVCPDAPTILSRYNGAFTCYSCQARARDRRRKLERAARNLNDACEQAAKQMGEAARKFAQRLGGAVAA